MLIRKEQLIAMLQAIDGNPLVLIEKDGGEYWGMYHDTPEVVVEQVPCETQETVFVGHNGDTTGASKFVPLEDAERRYIVLK